MKKIWTYFAFFTLGIFVTSAIIKFNHTDAYDLLIHRTGTYELWISNELTYNFPMAPYRHIVRYRKICENNGNICSEWSIVADFLLDSPTRADDWKLSGIEGELKIKSPEKKIVRQVTNGWLTESIQ